jgi:predicted dehydrogenase
LFSHVVELESENENSYCKILQETYRRRKCFEDCPTDVVFVSTYAISHLPITLDALALPLKGILVEKPLGDTWDGGNKVLASVRSWVRLRCSSSVSD